MLPKIRNLALRPRSGAVALAILITLSISATASAAVPPAALPGLPTQYVNQANAFSGTDGRTDFTVKFQLRQSSAATLDVANHAVASTNGCRYCGAFAIAFQVVVAAKQDLVTLTADNTADATSYACIKCATLAAAYQIVCVTDSPRLTWDQIWGLARIRAELRALRYSGLDPDQVQSRADDLANQAVSILEESPGPAPAFSPAINSPTRAAELTQDSGPFVDMFIKVEKPNG